MARPREGTREGKDERQSRGDDAMAVDARRKGTPGGTGEGGRGEATGRGATPRQSTPPGVESRNYSKPTIFPFKLDQAMSVCGRCVLDSLLKVLA